MKIKPQTKKQIIKYLSIIGAIALYVVVTGIIFGNSCLIKALIKFPCPFCGMTRAHLSALSFDFVTAFRYHPMFFIGVPFLALVMFEENFTGKLKKISNITVITIGLLFILVYIIRLICGDPYLFN